jgi:hypothetical protein
MNLENVQIRIRNLMALSVVQIKGATAQGDTFLNTLAESFLVPFLKEVYDLPNLKNLNQTEKKNFPGIDLADMPARLAFQVTSTSSSTKIKTTLKTFTKYKLYERFDRLIIYIISEKQERYTGSKFNALTEGKYSFDKEKDIVDFRDILATVMSFDIEKAERVLEILERNFGSKADAATQKSLSIPPQLRALVAGFEKQLEEHSYGTEIIIDRMLELCREFLDRHLINEATIFLSKIEQLLLEVDNGPVTAKAHLLRAILLIRSEQIPEGKKLLRQLIDANPHDIEAMLDYLEICENIPEIDDDVESIEQRVRNLASGHPKLLLIDLARQFEKQESIEIRDISEVWADDIRLNARFIRQYALVCDSSRKTAQRDALIARWENELPNSPRPHLFRALFRMWDSYRSAPMSLEDQTRIAQDLLSFSASERKKASAKDPINLRDQISWLMQEIRLKWDFSDETTDLSELRNRMFSLIEQCYFDKFACSILSDFLGILRLEPEQWRTISQRIQESNVLPSQRLLETLFFQALQYDDLYPDLEGFISKYGDNGLEAILNAIKNSDAKECAKLINAKKNSFFTLYMLESLDKHNIAVELVGLLDIDEERQAELLYAQFKILGIHKKEKEALDVIKKLPLNGVAPRVLDNVQRTAYRNKQWEIFIPSALQLLNFDNPQAYKSQLHAGLAGAYFDRGDDTNVIYHADQALSQSTDLGEENSQTLLHLLAQSAGMKGQYDEACRKFQKCEHINRSFSLFLEEANLYLKASFADKYKKCLALVMKAFACVDVLGDEHFLAALRFFIELGEVDEIPNTDEPSVEDTLFVKLDGFHSGWFYIGEEKQQLGAEGILPGSPNYNALIHKTIVDAIEWPADKYSRRDKHKILHIVTAPAYLAIRASEAMMRAAEIGNGAAWSVQVIKEDGSFDIEVLNQFAREHFQSNNEFFEKYINTPLPFTLLCRLEGSLAKALSKIYSERKGFIRCNDGTNADIDAQKVIANDVLEGASCFIDGLSAYMLAEAGLLEAVIKVLPNIGIPTSVIRMMRQIAADFDPLQSSIGRGGLIDGNFRFSSTNK